MTPALDHPARDPLGLLAQWLPANDDPERPAVTLATVDADGAPDARTVLLSEADRDGVYFHTDAASRKVAQLTAHPTVALVARWSEPLRQLVVRGVAERADETETGPGLRAPVAVPAAAGVGEHAGRRRAAARTTGGPRGTRSPTPTRTSSRRRRGSASWSGRPASRSGRATPTSVSHRQEYRLADGAWTVASPRMTGERP